MGNLQVFPPIARQAFPGRPPSFFRLAQGNPDFRVGFR